MSVLKQETPHPEARVRPETRRQTSLSEFEKLTPEILVDDEVSLLKTGFRL